MQGLCRLANHKLTEDPLGCLILTISESTSGGKTARCNLLPHPIGDRDSESSGVVFIFYYCRKIIHLCDIHTMKACTVSISSTHLIQGSCKEISLSFPLGIWGGHVELDFGFYCGPKSERPKATLAYRSRYFLVFCLSTKPPVASRDLYLSHLSSKGFEPGRTKLPCQSSHHSVSSKDPEIFYPNTHLPLLRKKISKLLKHI